MNNTKPQFHDEDSDGVKLVGEFFKDNPIVESIDYTADVDQYSSVDLILNTINNSKIYVEVKDRRCHFNHLISRKIGLYDDVVVDEFKKNRFEKENILHNTIVVNIWDDGFTVGYPSRGHLITKSVSRWTNSKSYSFNKTQETESNNYIIQEKRLWSMPIQKEIKRDLKLK